LFSDISQLKGIPIDTFVNAVFTASQVVLQKSIKEGFGLTVTEAMWKGKPVIGGNAQGILLQIKNGVNGFIVNNPFEAANSIIQLLNSPKLRRQLGRKAVLSVKKNFLLPRYLLQHLELYARCV
jgi:trehalose synthase